MCVFAIPLEMYGLLQNVQGKLVQYVPEINNEVLAQPVLSFGYLNSKTVVHSDDSDQLINLRKFLRRKKEGGNVILKDIDATQITHKLSEASSYPLMPSQDQIQRGGHGMGPNQQEGEKYINFTCCKYSRHDWNA